MSVTVGQLAKLSGLSVRSLHHYDETGLLCPSERSDAGYRLYSDKDVARLYQIQALRWLELPLGEVKEILEQGGTAIPAAVDRKIIELTSKIKKDMDLRARLMTLRTQHFEGRNSGTGQLLAAVEAFKHYEKHLSADDMSGFRGPSESEAVEWSKVYADAESAAKRNIPPDSDEAQEISYRWGVMAYQMAKGDLGRLLKTKLAYQNDEGVRRSMAVVTGTDPAVMQFVLAASHHAHLKLLAQYFGPEEITRLTLSNAWQSEWLRVVTAMTQELANQSPVASEKVQALVAEWTKQLDAFTHGDKLLKAKLLDALHRDTHLQKRWLVNEELLHFVHQAENAKADLPSLA